MDTTEFVSYLRNLDVRLAVDANGRLSCTAPKGVVTPELKAELKDRKQAILDFLMVRELSVPPPAIQRIERAGRMEPSSNQQQMWFLQRFDSENAAYHIGGGLRFSGRMDRGSLEKALKEIIRRHEPLRTNIVELDGMPTAVIHEAADWKLESHSLLDTPAADRENELTRIAVARIREPFDLASDTLMRASLITMTEEEHALVVIVHHVAADGWSLEIIREEVTQLYQAFSAGLPSPVPELPIQYVDYADWYRRHVEAAAIQSEISYWKQQLRGPLPVMELPTDRPRPAVMRFRGARSRHSLSGELWSSIRRFTHTENVTLFIALLAAFKILLYRYTRQPDVIVGSATAGRFRPELEKLVGLFINNLVLRTDLSGDPTVREVLARVRETALSAFSHEHVPLDYLAEIVRPHRGLNHSPLYQVMFVLQNRQAQAMELPGLKITPLEFDAGTSRFDISVDALEQDDALHLYFEYNTDLFDAASIRRMQEHYQLLMEAMIAHPEARISKLGMLTSWERRQLTDQKDATRLSYAREMCVDEWVERQAGETPEAVAVVFGEEQVTYRELSVRSNRLAQRLRTLGVGPGSLVGVCLDRGVDLVVAPLAVWKAGGAYVPLDPEYPRQRLAFMLEDSGAAVVVTESRLLNELPREIPGVICLDRERQVLERQSAEMPARSATAENLAYVIYTSGSTGQPKGVEIQHRALVNFLTSMQREPGMVSTDRLLAVTTLSFDIAGLELYLPLVSGARVVMAPRAAAFDGEALGKLLDQMGITIMQATPVTWRLLLEAGWEGRAGLKILCGGETLTRELAERLLASGAEVWNLYGPTESTIWSTLQRVQSGSGRVPIGHPIANTQVYVLDEYLQPVPPGVAGELYLGGEGLARGYLHRAELTGERFVEHPFQGGERLYRSGDLVRRLADGSLECLARVDHQVKLRGFRIELGEIEAALEKQPGVSQAVVVVREERAGDQRLTAYLTTFDRGAADAGVLRQALLAVLPEYMVPSAFVHLDKFPLTPNRKVDREALPAAAPQVSATSPHLAPRTTMESAVATIWQDLLRNPRVGVNENFFDLGGHSLLVVQLQSRLRRQFQREISLVDLFRHPTVAMIAGLLNGESASGTRAPQRLAASN